MNKKKDIFDELGFGIYKLLHGKNKKDLNKKVSPEQKQLDEIKKARIEKAAKIAKEKLEKENRAKEWPKIKDQILSKYQLPIADDAKNIAKELLELSELSLSDNKIFGNDSVSVFFITDERVVKQRYIEGGDKAIEKYANHLIEKAFIGGPITATLLRRLKLLEDAKREGNVIDTEIDIDGFVPNGRIFYSIKKIELDGQIIPARRKFSMRCEMTATLTEGFRVGPFVLYDGLYLSTKKDMEQITDEDIIRENKVNIASESGISKGERHGKKYEIEICPHGTDKKLYCNQCDGDIIVNPSYKKIIGMCIDVSGSMHGRKIEKAKSAIIKVLQRIPINGSIEVVIIIFSTDLKVGNYEVIIPFGTIYTRKIQIKAINKVDSLIAVGSTPLYDAINYFLDGLWSIDEEKRFKFFPYTYLIIVSDGEENQSELDNILYKGHIGIDGFYAKLEAYRNSGLVTEIIPFAYGDDLADNRLLKELKKISGNSLVNETNPNNIVDSLTGSVDSILYGDDKLKLMGMPTIKNKN